MGKNKNKNMNKNENEIKVRNNYIIIQCPVKNIIIFLEMCI